MSDPLKSSVSSGIGSNVRNVFTVGVLTVIIFFVLLVLSGGAFDKAPTWLPILLLIDMLVGSIAGLMFVGFLIVYLLRFSWFQVVLFCIPILMLLVFFWAMQQNIPAQTNQQPQAPQTIECFSFINGKSVVTTRENCQELSIQNNTEETQQAPRRINIPPPAKLHTVDVKPPPKLEFPKVTRCDNQYDLWGNFTGVKCYESAF